MATYLAPKTFVDGDYLTFTELNAVVGNNSDLHWLKNALAAIGITAESGSQTVDAGVVGCRLSASAQQIPDSQWTEVQFSTQRFGRHNGQDIAYTVSDYPTFLHLPTRPYGAMGGYWLIGAHIAWAGNVTGNRGIRLASHGNTVNLSTYTVLAQKVGAATAAGLLMRQSVVTVDDYNSGGGSYSLQVYQSSGDVLGIEQIANSSAEIWALKMGVDRTTDVT